MKARVKKTGEIVDVELVKFDYTKDNYITNNGNVYYADELDFNLSTPQKQSVTIDGWVARAEFGDLELYAEYPERLGIGSFYSQLGELTLPTDSFPDLKWEDEPRRCQVTITEL